MNAVSMRASPLVGTTVLLDAPWNVGLTSVLGFGVGELAAGGAMLMKDVIDGRALPYLELCSGLTAVLWLPLPYGELTKETDGLTGEEMLFEANSGETSVLELGAAGVKVLVR
jgi:hypothetical protein